MVGDRPVRIAGCVECYGGLQAFVDKLNQSIAARRKSTWETKKSKKYWKAERAYYQWPQTGCRARLTGRANASVCILTIIMQWELKRGAIVEQLVSSVTKVETDGAGEFEGDELCQYGREYRPSGALKDFVDELGAGLIGGKLMDEYGTWPMYSKFYDYNEPLFHHVHHKEEACAKVGVKPKHEHYFSPSNTTIIWAFVRSAILALIPLSQRRKSKSGFLN